jgi:hypothetical protein
MSKPPITAREATGKLFSSLGIRFNTTQQTVTQDTLSKEGFSLGGPSLIRGRDTHPIRSSVSTQK